MSETALQAVDKRTLAALKKLYALELRYQKLSQRREELKEKLLELFEANDIKKFENDDLTITYVAATTQERFDSGKFKKDYPTIYKEYMKVIPVKASIRIKLKEGSG